jgi:hypothetical protein
MHTYVHTHTHTYIHTYILTSITHIHTHINQQKYIHTYITHTHIQSNKHTYLHLYLKTHIHKNIFTCTHTHIHTDRHIQTNRQTDREKKRKKFIKIVKQRCRQECPGGPFLSVIGHVQHPSTDLCGHLVHIIKFHIRELITLMTFMATPSHNMGRTWHHCVWYAPFNGFGVTGITKSFPNNFWRLAAFNGACGV